MRYEKIDILNSRDELDKKLKKLYKYSLLNFAFVIADVLAGNSVFSSTYPFGKKKSKFENEIKELGKIKSKIIKLVEEYIRKFYSSNIVRDLSNLNPEEMEKFYISQFKLKPPFNYIDNTIKKLEEIVNARNVHPNETSQQLINRAIINQKFGPSFGKHRRPFNFTDQVIKKAIINQAFWRFFIRHSRSFKPANQVSFLLAPVMQDENIIHWENICNLICWFLAKLYRSSYESILKFTHEGGDPKVLKNQYRRIKGFFCYSSASYEYFPKKNNEPEKPCFLSNPVISVKFYDNKIKTIYKENDKLKVRESRFEHDEEENVIKEYEKDEEENESSNLLMEIA